MDKLPPTLYQYLKLKCKEYQITEQQLSKRIMPGSTGSLIGCIKFNDSISESKINEIAHFFNEDPLIMNFMGGKIPKIIKEMIISNRELQLFLIELIGKTNDKQKE
jgi:hypothetical protein